MIGGLLDISVSRNSCLLVFCHFPIWCLDQVWYLNVSIPDICLLLYCFAPIVCGGSVLVPCFVNVLWLFLTVPWVGLQCVIVEFPDHTHLLFNRECSRFI